MDSYSPLLNLSIVENNHLSIFTTFAKQSMINRLSNPINRNRSAAKILKVMSSTIYLHFSQLCAISLSFAQNLCIIAFFDHHITEFVQNQNVCIRLTSNDASCEFVHHHITGQLNLSLFLHAAQFRKESIVILRLNPFTKYSSSSFALHELVISLAYLMRLLYALSMTFPLKF